MKYDVIIIGGGAAGLFCAIEAGKRGRRTLVIEHNAQVGRKIIISGGGRCNFTNIDVRPENFISGNPHFCKSALARYTPQDFVGLVKKHKIDFYEKTQGQLFCRESSRLIVDMLIDECRKAKVEIVLDCSVKAVRKDDLFELETTRGKYLCTSLIIATGGFSFPKIGATGFGYKIAKQFGLKLTETRPSLVALVLANGNSYTKLAGISVAAAVTTGRHSFRENILFTHRGLSGPAILQISNYWQKEIPVSIDLLPENSAEAILKDKRNSKQTLANFLGTLLPDRFAEGFASANLPDKQLDQLSNREIGRVAEMLNNWEVRFALTEGYDRAEVTLGGVSTNELSSQTMEAKRIAGLHFIGEVVDVTGWLGGYNFQWAWASGFAAGNSV
ncbi:MAG: NAD(P)/FAD-dependent oxidoreductase [Saprospiraceae bacterium]|nr:NAD(P)/FAD-dependent oxidoreductase [Pyrinomonadaceae bacterium]